MVPNGPQQYCPSPVPLGPDGVVYRNHSLAAYQLPFKQYYSLSPYGEFADENFEYNLHGASYQMMPENVVLSSSYVNSNSGRGWTPTPQLPSKNNTLFLEQDATYNHGTYSTNNCLPARSMITSDPKSMSLNSMAIALPAPIPDRVLPNPSTGRQTQAPFLRSGESHSILPSSQPVRNLDAFSYNNGMMPTGIMNAKSLSSSSVVENNALTQSYLPLGTSVSESLQSSQISQYISSSQQQADIYTPSSGNGLYRQRNRSSSSLNDYIPSSRQPPQPSVHSQPNDHSSPPPTPTHQYVPYISPSYPQPPMEEMPVTLSTHRSSDAGIQAS